jgi:hypothetical protein
VISLAAQVPYRILDLVHAAAVRIRTADL